MTDAILCVCGSCGNTFGPVKGKANKFCGVECFRSAQRSGAYKRGPGPTIPRAPCSHCGKVVARARSVRRNGEAADKVFCDRACYDRHRSMAIKARLIPCARCGTGFDPMHGKTKFCGESCWKADKKAEPKKCLSCKCLFTPVKWHAVAGKMISYNGGKTCSPKCENDWIRNNPERKRKIGNAFRGHNHPNWQGGKSLMNNTSNRGPNWQKQRAAALKRDKGCVDCGISNEECREKFGRSLDVDHVVPFHNFSGYRKANALSNLQCRCASCHRVAEAKRTMSQMVLPMQDSEKRRHKGRAGKVSNAKLSELDVLLIRRRFDGGESVANIAVEFSVVTSGAVRDVAKRRTWRHI